MTDTPSGPSSLVRSYLALRKSIGVIGILLPFVLALGGLLVLGTELQTSISRYYHTGMRDVFVGSLCAVAVFLWSYQGYDDRDRIAGNLACVFALGVALLPTTPLPDPTRLEVAVGWLHVVSAAGFFLTLAYFCLRLFRLSDKERPTPRKILRNRVYTVCGWGIIGCLVGIAFVYVPAVYAVLGALKPVFWLEAGAIVAFGVAWFTKGEAILHDRGMEAPSLRVSPRIPEEKEAGRA
jgi:hypothetical protein